MKRLLAFILALIMAASLAACAGDPVRDDEDEEDERKEQVDVSDDENDNKENTTSETKVVAGFNYYVAIINGELYMFGEKNWAQAGTTSSSSTKPRKIEGVSDFVDAKTADFATAALTEDGDLWTYGYNEYGQLGNGTTDEFEPKKVLENVTSFAVAGYEMAAVTENGDLYAWGRHFGTTPSVIMSGVSYVTTSEYECIAMAAVTKNGELYYWGYDDQYSSLEDYVDKKDKLDFIYPVKLLDNVKDVFFGYDASAGLAAITNSGELFACGIYPQKPIGNQKGMIKIMDGVKDVEIAPGTYAEYLLILTESNEMYVYGDVFSYDQDGMTFWFGTGSVHGSSVSAPVKLLDNVKSIHAASSNCFAITNDNALYACGLNKYGECATGDNQYVTTPTKILDNVMYVTSSHLDGKDDNCSVAAITIDGSLCTWGYADDKKLGYAIDDGVSGVYFALEAMTNVKYVTFGDNDSKCCAAITNDNEIYIWGDFSDSVYYDSTEIQIIPKKLSISE